MGVQRSERVGLKEMRDGSTHTEWKEQNKKDVKEMRRERNKQIQ